MIKKADKLADLLYVMTVCEFCDKPRQTGRPKRK